MLFYDIDWFYEDNWLVVLFYEMDPSFVVFVEFKIYEELLSELIFELLIFFVWF